MDRSGRAKEESDRLVLGLVVEVLKKIKIIPENGLVKKVFDRRHVTSQPEGNTESVRMLLVSTRCLVNAVSFYNSSAILVIGI